jgi:hypothetical protein
MRKNDNEVRRDFRCKPCGQRRFSPLLRRSSLEDAAYLLLLVSIQEKSALVAAHHKVVSSL